MANWSALTTSAREDLTDCERGEAITGTYAAGVQRVLIGRVTVSVGAAVALLGTFLPWLRSGSRRRSSYEIFSLVDRLGISPSSAIGWGVRLWPLVPLLLIATVTLHWFPKQWFTGPVTTCAVAYGGVVSGALQAAPSTGFIAVEHGAVVTLAGSLLAAAGAVLTWSANRLVNRQ